MVDENDTHLPYDGITVAQIGQRLEICSAKQFACLRGSASHPLVLESKDILIGQQSVFGRALSFDAVKLWGKHQQGTEDAEEEEAHQSNGLHFERQQVLPVI